MTCMEAGVVRNTSCRQNPALGKRGHLRVKKGKNRRKNMQVMSGAKTQQRKSTVISGPSNSLCIDIPGIGKKSLGLGSEGFVLPSFNG